jgi:chromosome segregation ATPase
MSDFKTDFEAGLRKLGEINAAIDSNIRSKQEFSTQVISRLKDINQRIRGLADAITQLKTELTGLQEQVQINQSGISGKETEIIKLKEEIERLKQERDAAIAELEQLKKQYMADTQDFQKRIDDCEGQLRTLTDQLNSITAERDSLKTELQSKGDLASTHAGELQSLTEQNTQKLLEKDEQLKLQQEDCAGKMKNLQDEIAAKDLEIARLRSVFENEYGNMRRQIDELNRQNQELQQNIQQLQEQLRILQEENEDLKNRIISATMAIMEATNRLQELNDPSTFDQAGLNTAFAEVEASIQDISNAIQGRGNAVIQERQSNPNVVNFQGVQLDVNDIIQQLKSKPTKNSFGNDTSYIKALRAIQSGTNPEQALADAKVPVKNGKIMGGKTKKRKHKKQRGGFTYKNNAKRRTFTSSLKTTSTGSNFARGKSKKTSRH